MNRARHYGFVLLPGFSLLALGGALEVLHAANDLLGDADYRCAMLSLDGQSVAADNGVLLAAPRTLAQLQLLDGVFVVSDLPLPASGLEPLCAALRQRAGEGCVLGGIGSGAAVLARAGVLAGYRATLHWAHVEQLAESHAQVIVSANLYEIDRGRLSCAGATASLDMMLAWMAQRHGERAAQELLAHFGLERLRARDERQRVPISVRIGGGSAKLTEAVALMEANLGEPLPTEDIARLVGVSRRQLERLFKQHLDELPSRYYLELRLARARRLLQQSHQSILQIGLACGFSSGSHFSNAYRARYQHTPRDARSQRAIAWRDTQPTAGDAAHPEEEPSP